MSDDDEEHYTILGKVDAFESPKIVSRFKVASLPGMLYFHKGMIYDITDIADVIEVDTLYDLVKNKTWMNFPKREVPSEGSSYF